METLVEHVARLPWDNTGRMIMTTGGRAIEKERKHVQEDESGDEEPVGADIGSGHLYLM
jgi:hypothetical protein